MFSIPEKIINSVTGERIALYTRNEGEAQKGNSLSHHNSEMLLLVWLYENSTPTLTDINFH